MSFSHLDSLWKVIWLLTSNVDIFENGLQFIGDFIAIATLDIIAILKKDVCSSNLASSSKRRINTWLGPMFLPWINVPSNT